MPFLKFACVAFQYSKSLNQVLSFLQFVENFVSYVSY